MARHTNGADRGAKKLTKITPYPYPTRMSDWAEAKILPPEHLMGELFSTTSRGLIAAPTGAGKTMLGMAAGLHLSLGRDFLHWKVHRPARVLYVDGEMPPELAKERLHDTLKRAGFDMTDVPDLEEVDNFEFFCLNNEKERPPPLNTEEGQEFFDAKFFDREPGDERFEFAIFDNIASLLEGSLNEDGPWAAVMPWIFSLTQRKIGQLWFHHTNDNLNFFGTKTRDWHFDFSAICEKIQRPWSDIALRLMFKKTRRRKPSNWADFEDRIIRLERGQWFSEPIQEQSPHEAPAPAPRPKPPSPLAVKFYDALNDAICVYGKPRQESGGRHSVLEDEWAIELGRLALVNGEKPDAKRSLISKYRRELLGANWAACNGKLIWAIRKDYP
jgi:hypothetical protein